MFQFNIRGVGYKANFLHSVSFPIFQIYQNTSYLWIVTFIFGRCHSSLAVKYVCDSKIIRRAFGRSKIYLMEKLGNGALQPPTLEFSEKNRNNQNCHHFELISFCICSSRWNHECVFEVPLDMKQYIYIHQLYHASLIFNSNMISHDSFIYVWYLQFRIYTHEYFSKHYIMQYYSIQ